MIVCFYAHPDDETIMAGGMIAMLSGRGVPVHIVIATHGEGGEMGEPPVVADRALLGAAREAELICAVQALGATSVEILDYVDPVMGPDEEHFPFAADFDTLAAEFASIARDQGAAVVLTHGADGDYGHPAHKLVHQAVVHGIRDIPVYTTAAKVPGIEDRLWNESQPAHLSLDINPWAAAKIAAMECHRSQHALFKRRRKLKTVAEALRPVESVHRMQGEPDDLFASILREAGATVI